MFGSMPSQGFYLRHVKNISVSNVEISSLAEDLRPAFVLDDAEGADFFRVRTPRMKDVPTFALKNVADFSARFCKRVKDNQIDHVEKARL
jgi:hypothetical protein